MGVTDTIGNFRSEGGGGGEDLYSEVNQLLFADDTMLFAVMYRKGCAD